MSNLNKKVSLDEVTNMDFFMNNPPKVIVDVEPIDDEPIKKRRGRPKSNTEVITDQTPTQLQQFQSNQPYIQTYDETNNMLKTSIVQIDMLQTDIKQQIDIIKDSKTLKGKFGYLGDLSTTMASLINTKITAIREINKSITDSHNLDLKRIKDLKVNEEAKDDNKYIQDMYNAFISMGSYSNLNAPNIADVSSAMRQGSNYMRTDLISGSTNDMAFNAYMNNLSPTQNMMLLENNPDIQTVVVYDKATGNRYFEVMNTKTQQPVANTTKPDPMFLEELIIDLHQGQARDSNLDRYYPLIVINSDPTLSQY